MGDLSLIVLNANSKDGAAQALDVAKKLDHDGWIELMDYALVAKDEKGHVTAREMGDERSEKFVAATAGITGGILGAAFGGPAGAAAGVAAGALAGAGSMRLAERLSPDKSSEVFPGNLGVNNSVLAVIVEERCAERLDEELRKFGRTARRGLKRAERDAEFDAYLQRSKDKIQSIQKDIQAQLSQGSGCHRSGKNQDCRGFGRQAGRTGGQARKGGRSH